MNIKIKKNGFLFLAKNKIKCSIGKNGIKLKKKELLILSVWYMLTLIIQFSAKSIGL